MARPLDPFRALEVPRDATLDEVRASYRRLAKLYHPDSAGDRALPRFLAIQAAYEALTEGPGALRLDKNPRPRPAGRTARPSEADTERSRATREAAGRGGRPRQAPAGSTGADGSRTSAGADRGAPRGSASPAGTDSARAGAGRSGAGSTSRTRRDRRTPGSTSYDGADLEPFEPEWQGASWYGESSGTYWTINPKEFADPRKHGPEYQARGRRAQRGERAAGRPATAGPSVRRSAASARSPRQAEETNPVDPAASPTPTRGGPSQRPHDARSTTPDAATDLRHPAEGTDPFPSPQDASTPVSGRGAEPADLWWAPSAASPPADAPASARPPFAVFGVFAILMGAIGTILILSPAGPASAGFVPVVFLIAILAAAGLVLAGLRGGRRA